MAGDEATDAKAVGVRREAALASTPLFQPNFKPSKSTPLSADRQAQGITQETLATQRKREGEANIKREHTEERQRKGNQNVGFLLHSFSQKQRGK
ncbi:hypothetical protein Cni_G07403 [Canna indica]|uniref:Uncharacterized protein n=1 Tax=Canna indica TaxID=4628 RepID=A0AAQ3JZ22_9LILI|nr:hypothetical protein Cni_G07403 [Canna indica]